MDSEIPAHIKTALDAEIAADTDDEAGETYRNGLLDPAD
jgi:hypothetical protein